MEEQKIPSYITLFKGGTGEIIEKKSRFIASLEPVWTQEEAEGFIESVRKKHWDATHNCYAYVLGAKGEFARCSDDGEPSQTAGKPMLDVLLGQNIRNVCVVVTRYFGGTLLGTGGLVRAYSQAVQEGLSHCLIIEKKLAGIMDINCDYSSLGKIQYLAAQADYKTLNISYTDQVQMQVLVPKEECGRFIKDVTEATGARAAVCMSKICYYAMVEGLPRLFEE